jgi:hypothetical protein
MHNQLKAYFKRDAWYDKAPLNPIGREMVLYANDAAGVKSNIAGNVTAELTLGFWTGLTAGSYQAQL